MDDIIKNKDEAFRKYIYNFLVRTNNIFEYRGLPDTIPLRNLELMLQTHGFVGICKCPTDKEVYAFWGGLGGEPDAYYRPTVFTVSNPYLQFSKNYNIRYDLVEKFNENDDCIIIPNNSLYRPLLDILERYCVLLTENDISMRVADINNRIPMILTASDDTTRASAEEYIRQIKDGNIGIIADNAFIESFKSVEFNGANSRIIELIEFHQYLKASLYNEIGLRSNYNMKRETLTSNEINSDTDTMRPLIDDMLIQRQNAFELVNSAFGLSIAVDLNGAWQDVEDEVEETEELLEGTDGVVVDNPDKGTDEETDKEESDDEDNEDRRRPEQREREDEES